MKGNPSNLNSEYCDLCCDSISWCGADRSTRYSKHALICTQSYECTLVLYIYFVWSVHVAVISAHTDNWNTFCTFLHTEQEEKAAGSHDLMIATACANLLCISDAMQSRCQIFCYWKSWQESRNVRMFTGRLKRKRIGLSCNYYDKYIILLFSNNCWVTAIFTQSALFQSLDVMSLLQ